MRIRLVEDTARLGPMSRREGQLEKKGHGTSLRRHAMASILKRDDPKAVPPSRFHRTGSIGQHAGRTGADSGKKTGSLPVPNLGIVRFLPKGSRIRFCAVMQS